jgi:aryl-alcohol dehydrogenase-like predicted oxidoreductase
VILGKIILIIIKVVISLISVVIKYTLGKFGKQISDAVAEELMVKAHNEGVNFFDNAEIYTNGASEIVMGNILKKTKWSCDSYLVSSKVFFLGCGLDRFETCAKRLEP